MAEEARRNDPGVTGVWFFPTSKEVRLIEVVADMPVTHGDKINVFYFNPAPEHQMPALSGVGVIRPDDLGRLSLPEGWGEWNDGIEIYRKEAA